MLAALEFWDQMMDRLFGLRRNGPEAQRAGGMVGHLATVCGDADAREAAILPPLRNPRAAGRCTRGCGPHTHCQCG